MSSIVWFVSIAIITRLVESKFIDNELRTGLHLNKRDLRHINLEDNEAINTFETSQYQLRYKTQQRYRGLPVFGATLVVEQDPGDASKKIPIYGRWYDKTDIQQLVPSINPEFGEDEALQIALTALNINSKNVYSQSPAKLYIYYHDSFPFLCWIIKVSYSNPRKGDEVHHPVVIINALTGRVLQIYDEVFNINAGSSGVEACGDGGNLKTGLYRYCVDYPSLLINDNIVPVLENDVIQVYDNHGNPYDNHAYATKVTCSGSVSNWNATHNVTGNHTSPSCYIDDVYTNGAYCPACDIYAFANVVFEMFDEWSNATYPISAAFIPMKLFVHVGYNWVNANFDPYSGEMNFGDGATSWYPLTTLDITAHEIAHGYTDQGSDLIYSGESGGMNEAFSDIVGEVAEYWFFGENDWMTGGDIFKNVGEALRYMYDPPNDGISIDHYTRNLF